MKDWSDREAGPGDRAIPFEFCLWLTLFLAGIASLLADVI